MNKKMNLELDEKIIEMYEQLLDSAKEEAAFKFSRLIEELSNPDTFENNVKMILRSNYDFGSVSCKDSDRILSEDIANLLRDNLPIKYEKMLKRGTSQISQQIGPILEELGAVRGKSTFKDGRGFKFMKLKINEEIN